MAAVPAPPETWHTRLATCLADVQRAATGLLAVCEEPEARQTLKVRMLMSRVQKVPVFGRAFRELQQYFSG